MKKRFGAIVLAGLALGFGARWIARAEAQGADASGAKDVPRAISGLEEESYRALKAKDTKFWASYLSERFVSWGADGRIGKAGAVEEWSSPECKIASYTISELQVSQLTREAAVITHKTMVDGSCGGRRLPSASWTATGYVLEGEKWKAVFRAASAILDPAKLPKPAVDRNAAGTTASQDIYTVAMLDRERAIWDAWKDRDMKRLDALVPPEIQFINIFGTHIGTRAETLENWSGRGCDVKSFQLGDARATTFTPDFGILTLQATVDGTCFGQPVIPIWTSSFYVKHGGTWVWSFGINIPAHGAVI